MIQDVLINLLISFGYLGLFISSFIGSASIILPLPSFIMIFIAGRIFDPLLVGTIAGFGSALGELTGYGLGFGGRLLLKKRIKKRVRKKELEKWFKRGQELLRNHRAFLVIFIFAATPLPDDIIGLVCGSIRYDLKKFFIASLLGKIVLSLFLAYAGFYGLGFVSDYLW